MSKRSRLSSSSTEGKEDSPKHGGSSVDDPTIEGEGMVTLVERSTCVAQQVERNLSSTLDYLCHTGKMAEMVRYYIMARANASTIHDLLSLSVATPKTSPMLTRLHTSSVLLSSLSSSFSSSLPPPPPPPSHLSLTCHRYFTHWTQLPVDVWKRIIFPMLSHRDLLVRLQIVNRTLFKWVQYTSWVKNTGVKSMCVCVW